MANTYGAQSPIFYPESNDWVLQSQTITPRSATTSDATNEGGDIVERKYIGLGMTEEISETYALKQGTLANLPQLGYHPATASEPECIITSISVSTSNGDWPQLSVSFTRVAGGHTMIIADKKQYAFPALTTALAGKRLAQPFFITGAINVQSASISASISLSDLPNEIGEPCAWGMNGGTWNASIECLDGTPSFSPTADMGANADITSNNVCSYSNTAWGTISATIEGALAVSTYSA